MKNKIRLVAIFAGVIFLSFIPEAFPDFFGDWVCQGGEVIHTGDFLRMKGCDYGVGYTHNPRTHWGFRHWMLFACGLTLFIWNMIELFDKEDKK